MVALIGGTIGFGWQLVREMRTFFSPTLSGYQRVGNNDDTGETLPQVLTVGEDGVTRDSSGKDNGRSEVLPTPTKKRDQVHQEDETKDPEKTPKIKDLKKELEIAQTKAEIEKAKLLEHKYRQEREHGGITNHCFETDREINSGVVNCSSPSAPAAPSNVLIFPKSKNSSDQPSSSTRDVNKETDQQTGS